MLVVWGRDTAPNVRKVLWICAELQIPHERRDIGGPFGGTDSPEFRAMNPAGRIPVIQDGGFVLWESNAILRYLANITPGQSLYPANPQARATVEKWMDWQLAHLAPALKALTGLVLRRAPSLPPAAPAELSAAEAGVLGELQLIEDVLSDGRAYLAGQSLTLADMAVAYGVNMWSAVGSRGELPRIAEWYRRLQDDTAFRPLPPRKPTVHLVEVQI